jgi:hypothetical protein
MKKGTHTIPHLRPMTAADYSHIVQLAAKNSEGLDARCARYRRRRNAFVGVATFAVVVTVGLLTVDNMPATDSLYVSNISHRTETIQALDQILVASL